MRILPLCFFAASLFPISALANDLTKIGEVNSVLVEPNISGNSTVSFWKSSDLFIVANNRYNASELRFYFSKPVVIRGNPVNP